MTVTNKDINCVEKTVISSQERNSRSERRKRNIPGISRTKLDQYSDLGHLLVQRLCFGLEGSRCVWVWSSSAHGKLTMIAGMGLSGIVALVYFRLI